MLNLLLKMCFRNEIETIYLYIAIIVIVNIEQFSKRKNKWIILVEE